jgi:hypothetical protein
MIRNQKISDHADDGDEPDQAPTCRSGTGGKIIKHGKDPSAMRRDAPLTKRIDGRLQQGFKPNATTGQPHRHAA